MENARGLAWLHAAPVPGAAPGTYPLVECACIPAADVADPGRTVPRATMVGGIAAVVVYVLVCTIPMLVLPQHELATVAAPFALLMDQWVAAGSGRWIALFVIISGLGALNGWTIMGGELTRTMARNGVLPPLLGRNNRFGAPMTALAATSVFSSATVMMSYSKSLVSAFTFLVELVTAAVRRFYLCCGIALGILRYRKIAACRAWQALTMAIICTLCMVLAFVDMGGSALLSAALLIAAGLPVYAYTRWRGAATANGGEQT